MLRMYQKLFSVADLADIPDSWKNLFTYKTQVDSGMRAICHAFRVERGGYSFASFILGTLFPGFYRVRLKSSPGQREKF
jgi:hypothetical protein